MEDALRQIIQLVILCIPLIALPLMIKGSSSLMGKIAGGADKFSRGMGIDKGLGKAQGGLRGFAKERALDAETYAASGAYGNRLKRVGNFRERRKFIKENRAKERGRVQEDTLAKAFSGDGAEGARLGAAGVGGAEGAVRVADTVAAIARKRDIEELERAQLPEKLKKQAIATAQATMHSDPGYAADSNKVAKAAFEQAKTNRDEAGIRAAFAELSSNNYGVGDTQKLIADNENDEFMKSAMQKGVNDNWTNFKSKNAAVSAWSTDQKGRDIKTVAGDGGTYSGLTAEQLSSQVKSAAKKVVETKAISPEMAASVLNSDAQTNLSEDTRAEYEKIAARAGTGPTSTGSSGSSGSWNSVGGKSTTEGEIRFKR